MNEKKENNMYYQTNIKTSRNEDISFLQLSYGNFVSLDDYMLLKKENQQLKSQYCERIDCSGRIGNSKKVEELEKENQKYKELTDKVIDLLDNHQNNLYSKQARETLDDDIELVLKLLKEVE